MTTLSALLAETHDYTNDQSIKKAVMLGLGFAFLPEYLIKNELKQHQLQSINAPHMHMTETSHLAVLKDSQAKSICEVFINTLTAKL